MSGDDRRYWALVVGIVLLALAVRVPVLADPYPRFHPTRQYRDAVVARDLTYRLWGAPSPELEEAAQFALEDFGPKEPPILESAAAVLGVDVSADWWRARLLVAVSYLGGLVVLATSLRRRFGTAAAVSAMVVGALLPYLPVSTSSFQPDPVLVGMMFAAFGILLRSDEEPLSTRAHLAFGALGGVASLMKPTALPVLLLPYLWLHRGSWRSRRVLATVALLAAPALAWTASTLVFGDSLDSHASNSVVPGLLLELDFWQGWWKMLTAVVPVTVLVVCIPAAIVARGTVRSLVLGGLAGYALVGLTFTHHMSTHDYYHLIVLPMIVVGAGAAAVEIPARLPSVRPRLLVIAALAVAALFTTAGLKMGLDMTDSGADRSAAVASPFIFLTDQEAVTFTRDDGLGLEYLTWSGVRVWPTAADLAFQARSGEVADGQELLDELRDDGVEWFVYSVPFDASQVPYLVDLLDPFTVAACTDDAIVIDLTDEPGGENLRRCLEDELDLPLRDRAGTDHS